MRKMLLLLISGLLIACIAGSAMAGGSGGGSGFKTDEDLIQTVNGDDVVAVPEDSSTQITLDLTGPYPAGYANVKISVSGSGYKVTIPKEGIFNKGSISNNDLIVSNGDPFYKTLWIPDKTTHKLTVEDTDPGDNGPATLTVTVDGICTCTQVIDTATLTNEIPEFPSVAVPIAAVLGLVFIFGRKKEGL